jgi:UDPglucose 6-dehydrogenase
MANIGIVGYGHVGKAMHKAFPEAIPYDEPLGIGPRDAIDDCDIAIICVPTPMLPSGSCDVSIVEHCVSWIQSKYILIKSTVPPGTTQRLAKKYGKHLVFSPEYTGESKYYSPYTWSVLEEPLLVLGGERHATKFILDVFKKKLGPVKRYFQTDSTTAEIAKYMENCFFATKVTFCNEFANICKAFGTDYNEVREMFLADTRINPMHTLVFEDEPGFGGKCLPKDLNAIVAASKSAGYSPDFLSQVLKSNDSFRR